MEWPADPEAQPPAALSIVVHQRDRYCFKCGSRRVSKRAVRAVVFAAVAVIVLVLVIYRAVRRGGSVWAMMADVALALVALFTPIPV